MDDYNKKNLRNDKMSSQVCQNMMDGKNQEDVIRQEPKTSNDDKILRNSDVDQKKLQSNSQAQDVTKMMSNTSIKGSNTRNENDIWSMNSNNNIPHNIVENFNGNYKLTIDYLESNKITRFPFSCHLSYVLTIQVLKLQLLIVTHRTLTFMIILTYNHLHI